MTFLRWQLVLAVLGLLLSALTASADQCSSGSPSAAKSYCLCKCPGKDKDEDCILFRGNHCCRNDSCDAYWSEFNENGSPEARGVKRIVDVITPKSTKEKCGPVVILDTANPASIPEYWKYMDCINGKE